MNSVLQVLFHIPKIANCLLSDLNNINNKCKIRNCVSCMVVSLYGNTYTSETACSPYQLYSELKKTNSQISGLLNGQHQDAHEFLIVFNQVLEQQPHSVRWFPNNFSIDLATHILCGSCGKVHKSSSEVTDLAIHVVKNGTVQDAVDSYFNYDDIQYQCEGCRAYVIARKKHFIVSAPAYLCIQIRRFSGQGSKITDKIEILPKLSVKQHFLKTQDSESAYKLVAVVNHFGESRNIGHYNAIIVTTNGEHYEVDDRNVRKVSSNLVSGKNAYMLFYELTEVIIYRQSYTGGLG